MIILFYIIYGLSAFWAIFNILLYGDRPARSVGWLLIVIIFPVIGVLLYLLFGVNRKKFKFFTLNFNAKRKLYDLKHKSETIEDFAHRFNSEKFGKLGTMLKRSSGFPAVEGNKIKLLKDGKSTFDDLFETFSKAKKFIHIQYYIIEEGELLNRLIKLFSQKIDEGVEIRVLYDAFGSNKWKNKSIKNLERMGVEIFPILPLKIGTILSTLNYRNHRKIAIVDGIIGFTGGVNISDKYIKSHSNLGIWEDLHLKINGPIVDHLHRIFIKDFYFASNKTLLDCHKYLPMQEQQHTSLAQIVAGGPDLNYLSILQQYTAMIHSAEKSVYIENPYFIPNKVLLEALKMAVLRGIEVTVIVPQKTDSRMAKYSMYANFEDLLKTGVKIRILEGHFLHSKLIIIDEEIASVGSGNFDYRSFEHNYEANIIIYDQEIAKELSDDFNENASRCLSLEYETFKDRSLKTKLLEGMAKIFSPLL